MTLKLPPPRPMPREMAAWGAKHLDDDDAYKLIGDTLYEQYHDEEFADRYHKEGQPGLSPVLLAFVTVFQALEDLADRKAARMVVVRDDWKYALVTVTRFSQIAVHDFGTRFSPSGCG